MIKQKWQVLNDREKKLILIAGVLILFYLIYVMFLTKPKAVNNNYSSFRLMQPSIGSRVEQNKKKFTELKPQIEKIKLLQKQIHINQKLSDTELLNTIKTSIEKMDVTNVNKAVIESQQNGKGVLVKYETVAFDKFIEWLQKINLQFGLTVSTAKIEAVDKKTGYISAELLIK